MSLQSPLLRLRGLIEEQLREVSVPYATEPASRTAQQSYAAGLHRTLDLIDEVAREQEEIAEQMRNDPPGTVY
jgi:hypothetical protein